MLKAMLKKFFKIVNGEVIAGLAVIITLLISGTILIKFSEWKTLGEGLIATSIVIFLLLWWVEFIMEGTFSSKKIPKKLRLVRSLVSWMSLLSVGIGVYFFFLSFKFYIKYNFDNFQLALFCIIFSFLGFFGGPIVKIVFHCIHNVPLEPHHAFFRLKREDFC